MADNDILGQFEKILTILRSNEWIGIWNDLGFAVKSFADLGLKPTASDREVWDVCQASEIVLVTGNRNSESLDSLEATIQACGTSDSLPVITIGSLDSFAYSKDYVDRSVVKLLEYLMEQNQYRGAGRLYIP